jgi:hypothetical protein
MRARIENNEMKGRGRIDHIMVRHQDYNVRNQKFMRSAETEAIKIVFGPYDRFWSRWTEKKFSKTPEKWICYRLSQATKSPTFLMYRRDDCDWWKILRGLLAFRGSRTAPYSE